MSYLIPVSMAWSDQEYCFSAWMEWKSIPSSLPSFRDIPPGAIFTLGWVERELLKIKCLDQENDPGRSWYPVLSIQDSEPSASIKRSHLSHILRMFPFLFCLVADGALLARVPSFASENTRVGCLQRNERCHKTLPGCLPYVAQT